MGMTEAIQTPKNKREIEVRKHNYDTPHSWANKLSRELTPNTPADM